MVLLQKGEILKEGKILFLSEFNERRQPLLNTKPNGAPSMGFVRKSNTIKVHLTLASKTQALKLSIWKGVFLWKLDIPREIDLC
jgi:hypothetical protein